MYCFWQLQETEDPNSYLQKRPLSSPVLLVTGTSCLIAIGATPVTTFPKEDLHEGVLYLMAYYYTLHLTYPKCVATVLSVIQTEILNDRIHDGDATGLYKRALAEWKSFTGKQALLSFSWKVFILSFLYLPFVERTFMEFKSWIFNLHIAAPSVFALSEKGSCKTHG